MTLQFNADDFTWVFFTFYDPRLNTVPRFRLFFTQAFDCARPCASNAQRYSARPNHSPVIHN